MRYPAYIELAGRARVMGYVFRLPGLFVESGTPEETLARLPVAIAAEHEWLARHGVRLDYAAEPVELEEAERVDMGTDVSRGLWRGLFQYELRRTSDADVATALERARFARADLLELLRVAGDEAAAELGARLVAHADAEWELLSKLGIRERGQLPDAPGERLAAVRVRAEERFANLLPGDRERLAVFDGEKWTTRKVLRCFVVGERRLLADAERKFSGVGSA